jgi:murein DD-endopeptidase MepM/ murein hydrolase activator NlpD
MIAAVAIAFAALAPGCYVPPVTSPIVDGFRQPSCLYCAGNRGLEYEPPPGATVRAAQAGVVEFSGVVVRVRYVVVKQTDGLRASYGYLASTRLREGDVVATGDPLGTSTGRFFFSLRDGDRYLDPQPRLGVLVGRRRLVPVDGSPGRRPGPVRMVCP